VSAAARRIAGAALTKFNVEHIRIVLRLEEENFLLCTVLIEPIV
jgi:hypothetical protein